MDSRSPGAPSDRTCPSTGSTTARSTVAGRALRRELEVAQLDDLVAPELEAHRVRHAEGVDVEDAAAQAELRDVLYHGHALEPDALQVLRQLARAAHVALAQLDAQLGQRARQAGALQHCARGGEQDADLAAAQPLQRLHALAGDLDVRLDLAESFARRVERHGRLVRTGSAGRRARRSACGTPSAATTRKRVGRRRARAATSVASAEPGRPVARSVAPGAGRVLSRRANAGRRSIASSRLGSDTRRR